MLVQYAIQALVNSKLYHIYIVLNSTCSCFVTLSISNDTSMFETINKVMFFFSVMSEKDKMQFVSMSTRWSSPPKNSDTIIDPDSNERGHLLLLQWLSFHMP